MKYYIQIKNNIITNCVKNFVPNSAKPYFTEIETDEIISIGDTYINGVITHNTLTKTFDLEKIKYKQEIKSIQKWFADNDWKINKIVIGEWSTDDERWQSYLEERTAKRKRYDELLAKVGE